MNLLPFYIAQTASGADVLARKDGSVVASFDTLTGALDSLLTDAAFEPGEGLLRADDGALVGKWRWLDATAEEPAPASDGSQVTRDLIAKMAAKLNASGPVPMDGGENGEAHQQLVLTSTHADGYAHVGVEVRTPAGSSWTDDDGEEHPGEPERWHLYLRCELSPSTAKSVDQGLLAYGSIGFDEANARLLQHALTNIPAVEGLTPNNAIRNAKYAGRMSFRSQRIDMTTSNPSKRGAALDLFMKLALLAGISTEGEDLNEIASKLAGNVWRLGDAAVVEQIVEGGKAPEETATLDANAAKSGAGSAAKRAIEGFADAAAQEMWTSEALNALRAIFGKPEEPPASVLEMLNASTDAFKGALGSATPPDSQDTADASAMSVPALTAEVRKLSSAFARRDARDQVVAAFARSGVPTPTEGDLEKLVDDAVASVSNEMRARVIATSIAARNVPPSGTVFPQRNAPADGSTVNKPALIEAEAAALRSQFPGEPGHLLFARARRAIEKKFPALS